MLFRSKMPATAYSTPFFQNEGLVQNFGIVVGTILYLMTAGKFVKSFKSGLRIPVREALFYGFGGITMGLGTRLANGCNVGALYSPIAELSLSGWIFLVFMVLGAIVSEKMFFKFPSSK